MTLEEINDWHQRLEANKKNISLKTGVDFMPHVDPKVDKTDNQSDKITIPSGDDPLELMRQHFQGKILYLGWRGSIAHGLREPNSTNDKDLIGIYLAPLKHYLGLTNYHNHRSLTKEIKVGEYDIVLHEVRKFIYLLLKGNPSVLEVLWTPIVRVHYQTATFKRLILHRNIFAAKSAYMAFKGFALAQLRRLTRGNYEYMTGKRKEAIEKYGYDTKNGTHLIRLLKMAIEFMSTGQLFIERTVDRPFLLGIKRGEYDKEVVEKTAMTLVEKADRAFANSTLPDNPDRDKAEELLIELICFEYKLFDNR